jgi:integrase
MNLSKRTVESLPSRSMRYFVWDQSLKGFGVRIEPSGRKAFLCRYRFKSTRRQYLIGTLGTITAEQARTEARRILASAALGKDAAQGRYEERRALRFEEVVEMFFAEHGPKLKPSTLVEYKSALRRHAVPAIGRTPADSITTAELSRLHHSLGHHPARANRVISYLGGVLSWASINGYVPRGFNPSRDVRRYREQGRERFLSTEELKRMGQVISEAETTGLNWVVKTTGPKAKHLAKTENRRVVYPRHVTNAIRLLLLTGCRLREILHLRWKDVDLERRLLHLPDSKTGKKTVILNESALNILTNIPRQDTYVIASDISEQPRHDLKRPWDHIRRAAGLDDVRLHDLRHTHASIGVASGLGLPIIGKLLGHASPITTARYAHLGDDPVRRASDVIGRKISKLIELNIDL